MVELKKLFIRPVRLLQDFEKSRNDPAFSLSIPGDSTFGMAQTVCLHATNLGTAAPLRTTHFAEYFAIADCPSAKGSSTLRWNEVERANCELKYPRDT